MTVWRKRGVFKGWDEELCSHDKELYFDNM